MMRFSGVLALGLCGILSASASRGQNLLPNAGFNTNINGWEGFTLAWSSLDAKGSSGSGSLQMTVNAPVDNNGFAPVAFCLAVTPGQTYHQGASFYFPGGQSHDAGFAVQSFYLSSANCTGSLLGQVSTVAVPAVTKTWFRLDTQPTVAPAGASTVEVVFGVRKIGDGGSIIANLDDAVFESAGANLCYSTDAFLCLGSRFTAAAQWSTGSGNTVGHAVQLTSDTGYFWFFSPSNIEMIIKALDGCSINSRKWVFAGGLTNVNVVSTVTDLQTGTLTTYTNPLNTAFQPIQDTSAFSTCP
jgi:hypothetical protein